MTDDSRSLARPSVIKRILAERQIRLQRKRGQNLLADGNILDALLRLAEIGPTDGVLEIGAGIGTLTLPMAERAARVWAIEIDRGLFSILREQLEGCESARLIRADALDLDWEEVVGDHPGPVKGVSNLPYQITSPVISSLLKSAVSWERLVLMVQKEVAERIVAGPGSDHYGSLAVFVGFYARAELCLEVSRRSFFPPPKVRSAVVRLRPRAVLPPVDPEGFESVVRAAFNHPRKTVENSLRQSPHLECSRASIARALSGAGIDGSRRPATLSGDEYVDICKEMASM